MTTAGAGAGSTTANIIGTTVDTASKKQQAHKRNKKNKVKGNARMASSKIKETLTEALSGNERWLDFIDTFSSQVIMSDKKLQKLIDTLDRQRETTINKAVTLLKNKFSVPDISYKIDGKATKDDDINNYKAVVKFSLGKGKTNGAKPFKITVQFDEDDTPTIFLDDETRDLFSKKMREDAAKLIRGALLLVQDKEFTKLDGAKRAITKLNTYMDTIDDKLNKMLSDLTPVDTKVLKSILKSTKYKKV